jgi:4-diphosphocytidyl-2-C-methyl-D-erythritol kinase
VTPDRRVGKAPGKVNLVLEVLGRRPDSYHELRTVLQELALHDTVTVTLDAPRPGVSVSGPFASGTPADTTNLAWRAAQHLADRTGHDTSRLQVHIEKQLPAAAGLGGGASDAATTLKLLSSAWAPIDGAHMASAASAVGSDEAFFLVGGTALASGRGEIVQAMSPLPRHDVVLFVPPATLAAKTSALFAALSSTPFDRSQRTDAFRSLHSRAITVADTFNAFERVAFDVFPGLAALKVAIERATGAAVRLAGAGPTLFWIGPPGDGAAIAAAAAALDCHVLLTSTAP